MPCNQPPWGRLFAINVNTGEIAWQTTLGMTEACQPINRTRAGRISAGRSRRRED